MLMRLEARETCAADWFLWKKALAVFTSGCMSGDESGKSAKGRNVARFGHKHFSLGIPGIREHYSLARPDFGLEREILCLSEVCPLSPPFRDNFAFVQTYARSAAMYWFWIRPHGWGVRRHICQFIDGKAQMARYPTKLDSIGDIGVKPALQRMTVISRQFEERM